MSFQLQYSSRVIADEYRITKSFHITVAETVGAVAEVSMTMSEASVETAMVRNKA